MTKYEIITNNMQSILDVANSEISCYGVRLDTIMLTNCTETTFDAKFIFSAQANPPYDAKQSIQSIVRSVLNDFISQYIHSPFTLVRSYYDYYF